MSCWRRTGSPRPCLPARPPAGSAGWPARATRSRCRKSASACRLRRFTPVWGFRYRRATPPDTPAVDHPVRRGPRMIARVIPVDPFDLVVFGATGDLAAAQAAAGPVPARRRRTTPRRRPHPRRLPPQPVRRGFRRPRPQGGVSRRRGCGCGRARPVPRRASATSRPMPATTPAGPPWPRAWANGPAGSGCSTSPPRPELFGPICDRLGHARPVAATARGWWWKSRSAKAWPRPAR